MLTIQGLPRLKALRIAIPEMQLVQSLTTRTMSRNCTNRRIQLSGSKHCLGQKRRFCLKPFETSLLGVHLVSMEVASTQCPCQRVADSPISGPSPFRRPWRDSAEPEACPKCGESTGIGGESLKESERSPNSHRCTSSTPLPQKDIRPREEEFSNTWAFCSWEFGAFLCGIELHFLRGVLRHSHSCATWYLRWPLSFYTNCKGTLCGGWVLV